MYATSKEKEQLQKLIDDLQERVDHTEKQKFKEDTEPWDLADSAFEVLDYLRASLAME